MKAFCSFNHSSWGRYSLLVQQDVHFSIDRFGDSSAVTE